MVYGTVDLSMIRSGKMNHKSACRVRQDFEDHYPIIRVDFSVCRSNH